MIHADDFVFGFGRGRFLPQPDHVVFVPARVFTHEHSSVIEHQQVVGPCEIVDAAFVLCRCGVRPARKCGNDSVDGPCRTHRHSVHNAARIHRDIDVTLSVAHGVLDG